MKHNEDYLNELLKEEDAAEFLGVSVRTLQGWRFKGGGPKFIKISHRAIRYRRKDLIEWIEGKVRTSTSDFGEVENGL
ncbi:MAG: helix-turn-helix domain-containing protein [Nitrospina sp.]|jgi:predicted DNA-binding transcriptional regulator AlpA|nr:helix-turn-helix domain-containing protein [Nitrospina sp.]MBT3876626.1 helix-turn-helix domain-containing protein [Nitrospina sp.]MBT4049685.1 helix-turn-helix domain-containing protein [Nitrospina sp.]MBT4556464.1 helix-turn-helix domain-containing protein [Nitrospina sp.]